MFTAKPSVETKVGQPLDTSSWGNKAKLAVLALMSVPLLAGCYETGTGEKLGGITRLNKQGLFFKTWEGEIIRGGLNGQSGVMGTAFHFTIEDDALAQRVRDAMERQQEVKITYRKELLTLARSESHDYFLTGLEIVNQQKEQKAAAADQSPAVAGAAIVGADNDIVELLKVQAKLIEKLAQRQLEADAARSPAMAKDGPAVKDGVEVRPANKRSSLEINGEGTTYHVEANPRYHVKDDPSQAKAEIKGEGTTYYVVAKPKQTEAEAQTAELAARTTARLGKRVDAETVTRTASPRLRAP